MKTILFQGDSITDAGRARDNDSNVGIGYPVLVKGTLGFEHPGEYTFLNRGISGNRVVDVYARIKSDIINLKPDVMSILIGVNDVWHEFSRKNGVDAEKFEKVYSMLGGKVEAYEFTALEGAPYLNIPLNKLNIRKGILVSVLVRERKCIIPFGSDEIEAGDTVILTAKAGTVVNLEDAFDLTEIRK